MKKKVLTINCLGDEGSIVKIIKDVENYTKDDFEYFHCYQIGEKSKDNRYLVAGWNVTKFYYVLARITGLKYGVGTLPTLKLIRKIKKIRPNIIHIHCPNFYSINLYLLFGFLKKYKVPVLITNHAEFFYTGNCAHSFECDGFLTGCKNCTRVFDQKHKYLINRTHLEWKKMKKAFEDTKIFRMTVVSSWQFNRIKISPITKNMRVDIVKNAVETEIFKPVNCDKEKNKISNNYDYTVLQVTSSFSDDKEHEKGGYYFIKLAEKMPNIQFWVAGNINVSDKFKGLDNLLLLGKVTSQYELAKLYNCADVTVLTSRRETYGMACAESLCCGTPVIGFKSGGTESIALKEYSEFCDFADLDELQLLLSRWLAKSKELEKNNISIVARKEYAANKMASAYKTIYEEMLLEIGCEISEN